MIAEWVAVTVFFFISNKYWDNPLMLMVSYVGFVLAMALYTKAIVNKAIEIQNKGENDEDY